MSYLASRNVSLFNSTVTASTMKTSAMTYSTMVGSTITASSITTPAMLGTVILGQNVSYPNRYLETGTDAANTMYLDFHSNDATLPDYSTRIQSYGGSTTGTGTLAMYASTIGLVPLGSVGVGTTTPTGSLHLFGTGVPTLNICNTSTVNYTQQGSIGFNYGGGSTGTTNSFQIVSQTVNRDNGAGPNYDYGAQCDLVFQRKTNNLYSNNANDKTYTEVMRLGGASGCVGIGTTAPSQLLHVHGTGTPAILIKSNSGGTSGNTASIILSNAGYQMGTITSIENANGYGGTWGAEMTFGTYYSSQLYERMRISATGNVGIGTNNPSYPLHIYTGNASPFMMEQSTTTANYMTLKSNGTVYGFFGLETSAGGGLFGNNTGYGMSIGTPTATNFNIATNNLVRATITSGGSVGIGTTVPGYTLHIVGNAYASTAIYSPTFSGSLYMANSDTYQTTGIQIINSSSGSAKTYQFNVAGTAGWGPSGTFGIYNSSASSFSLCISPTGYVGIGMTTPGYLLTVGAVGNPSANSAGTTTIQTYGNINLNRNRIIFSVAGNDWNHCIYNAYYNMDNEGVWDGMKFNVYNGAWFRVGTASGSVPTTALFINSSGYVGIGTTIPIYPLDVAGNLRVFGSQSGGGADYLVLHNADYSVNDYINFKFQHGASDSARCYIQSFLPGGNHSRLRFFTTTNSATVQRMAIDGQTGCIGIGVDTPSYPLHIAWTLNQSPALYGYYGSAGYGNAGGVATSLNISLYVAGWAITPAAWGVTSDRRIKTNIEPVSNMLTIIGQINVVKYDYIDPRLGREECSVIAQELNTVFPNAINTNIEYVTNIMKECMHTLQDDIVTISVPLQSTADHIKDIKVGSKLKLVCTDDEGKTEKDVIVNILTVSFTENIITVTVWDNYQPTTKIIVYGTQVDDFMSIDKPQLGVMALQGVKELHEIIKTQQQMIDKLLAWAQSKGYSQ